VDTLELAADETEDEPCPFIPWEDLDLTLAVLAGETGSGTPAGEELKS
jgi:hypothetical protein